MTEYRIQYSEDAVLDLNGIYSYIATVLLAPETAASQIKRIRTGIRSLSALPLRHEVVTWEPWHSMQMHLLPIDKFMVYYLVDRNVNEVTIVRILYGARNIEKLISNT